MPVLLGGTSSPWGPGFLMSAFGTLASGFLIVPGVSSSGSSPATGGGGPALKVAKLEWSGAFSREPGITPGLLVAKPFPLLR